MNGGVQVQAVALLPCPFCGHDTPELERMGTPRQSCIVICGNCGARHESSDEGANSGSSWNERAAIASTEAQPAPMTHREAACILAINAAISRMEEGCKGDAITPLLGAKALFADAADPQAQHKAEPVAMAVIREAYEALFGASTMVTHDKAAAAACLLGSPGVLMVRFNDDEAARRAHRALRLLEEAAGGLNPTSAIDAHPPTQPKAEAEAAPTQPNLACKSVQARLAAQWGYVPAPTQPVALTDGRETAIQALSKTWALRSYGQHAGYLSAPEVVDIVLRAIAQRPEQPTQAAPEGLELYQPTDMRDGLVSIRRYGLDTLSGRTDGPADAAWYREAVNEMTRRARVALEQPTPASVVPR